jgi:hypothetical protein
LDGFFFLLLPVLRRLVVATQITPYSYE